MVLKHFETHGPYKLFTFASFSQSIAFLPLVYLFDTMFTTASAVGHGIPFLPALWAALQCVEGQKDHKMGVFRLIG